MNFTSHNNNSILNVRRAMPLKDLTSSNEAGFAGDRKEVSKIPQTAGKKWYGNSASRDASQISRNRRVNASKTTINTEEKPLAFTNTKEETFRNNALQRVRNSGYTVPPKVFRKQI